MKNTGQAQAVVLDWCYGFYNHDRRHSTIGMMSPIHYENTAPPTRKPHMEKPSTIRGDHTFELIEQRIESLLAEPHVCCQHSGVLPCGPGKRNRSK